LVLPGRYFCAATRLQPPLRAPPMQQERCASAWSCYFGTGSPLRTSNFQSSAPAL